MDITIVLFIISGLLGVINILLGLGYKNLKEQIKISTEKAETAISENAEFAVDLANTKTNYVSRFNHVNNTINNVEKSILAEIRKLSENMLKLKIVAK